MAFDAQRAVKMEAQELKEYMAELFSWSKDMKRKAEAPQAAPPPVNASGSSSGQQTVPSSNSSTQQPARHPAAHTYEHYHDKWDKFDVDAALAADEQGGSAAVGAGGGAAGSSTQQVGQQQLPGSTTSQPMAIPQARLTVPVAPSKPAPARQAAGAAAAAAGTSPPTTAEGWKDAGNAHFRRGQYERAAECYSRSLVLEPGCLAAANRAMALLKLGRAAEAEADCSDALRLDPLYVKAYQRRATARRQQGRLLEAVGDCEAALRLEPNNKQAAADRDELVAALLRKAGLQTPARFDSLPVTVAGAAASPMVVEAAEVEEAEPMASVVPSPYATAAAGAAAAVAAEPVSGPAAEPLITVSSTRHKTESGGAAGPPATQQQKLAAAIQVLDSRSEGSEDEVMPDLAEQPDQPRVQQAPQPPPTAAAARAAAAAAPIKPAASAPAPFRLPRTGLDFEKAWKALKGNRQQQAAYLLALRPGQLPALLRQALTPGLLAAAAAALLRPALQQQPGAAVALLEGLAQVARFDLNLLSVPRRQREELAANWDAAAAELGGDAGQAAVAEMLASLRQKYKL